MRRYALSVLTLILLCSYGLLVGMPVAAQTATITIEPSSLARGSNIAVVLQALAPNSTYTIDFVLVAEERVVFSTERTTDGSGSATISIRSDATDVLGEYRVDVRDDNETLLQGQFMLVEASATPTAAPNTFRSTSTPAPTTATSSVSISVTPPQGRVRDTFRIDVSQLQPAQTVFVTVRERAANQIVYDREWTADARGQVTFELFTTADTPTGEYIVEVSDSSSVLMGSTTFLVESVGGRGAILTITPKLDAPETAFDLVITNSSPFNDLTFEVTDPDSGESVFESIARTNVDGTVTVYFPLPAEVTLKPFEVRVSDRDGEITSGVIPTDGSTQSPSTVSSAATLRVNPETGAVGRVFNISLVGLSPDSSVTIRIISADGQEVASFEQQVNRAGSSGITWGSADAATGTYTAEALVNGDVVATGTLEITSAPEAAAEATAEATPEVTPDATAQPVSSVTMTIEPTSGVIGTRHQAVISGLPASTPVTLTIFFNGLPVLTTTPMSRENGELMLTLLSEPTDAPGLYTLEATVDREVLASATFEIMAAAEPIVMENVRITITPAEGAVGTSHLVEVSGLGAERALTVQVTFEGNEVYTTDRAADAGGLFSLRLKADADDAPGVYTVNILADGQTVASADFEVTTDTTTLPATPVPTVAETPVPPDVLIAPNAITTETINNELTATAPVYTYEFNGMTGDLLAITATSQAFDTYLSVTDSSGYEIASNDDSDGTNSRIASLVLPYEDTYTVTLTSFAYHNDSADTSGIGGFTLTVDRILPTSIELGTVVQVDFAQADRYYVALTLTNGTLLNVRGFGNGLDTQVEVFSSQSYGGAYDDDSGSGYDPELLNYAVVSDGSYIVMFSTVEQGEGGLATLEVSAAPTLSLDDASQIVRLTSKATSASVEFSGSAGDEATLTLLLQGGSASDVSVTAVQDGLTLMTYTSAYNVIQQLALPIAVPADGTVKVIITTYSGTSTYEVNVAYQTP